jgi:hypothetical protein
MGVGASYTPGPWCPNRDQVRGSGLAQEHDRPALLAHHCRLGQPPSGNLN